MTDKITVKLNGTGREERFKLKGLDIPTIESTFGVSCKEFRDSDGDVVAVGGFEPGQTYTLHPKPGNLFINITPLGKGIHNCLPITVASLLLLHICLFIIVFLVLTYAGPSKEGTALTFSYLFFPVIPVAWFDDSAHLYINSICLKFIYSTFYFHLFVCRAAA